MSNFSALSLDLSVFSYSVVGAVVRRHVVWHETEVVIENGDSSGNHKLV